MDSECSKHITGDPSRFSSLKSKKSDFVIVRDNSKGKSWALVISVMYTLHIYIKKMLLVDNLKHNMLSISQSCDKCFLVDDFTFGTTNDGIYDEFSKCMFN